MSESESTADDDSPAPTRGDVYHSAVGTLKAAWKALTGWVQERTRLTQILLAAGVSQGVSALSNYSQVLNSLLANIPVFTTNQLLVALIGVVIGQTTLQVRRFNRLHRLLVDMDSPLGPRADGGSDLPPRDNDGKFTEEGTSGGGAIGGAIAGAALGSSFGPGGTVFGALFGAIVGDELEKQSEDQ